VSKKNLDGPQSPAKRATEQNACFLGTYPAAIHPYFSTTYRLRHLPDSALKIFLRNCLSLAYFYPHPHPLSVDKRPFCLYLKAFWDITSEPDF